MIKTYRHKTLKQFTTTLFIKDKKVRISFLGGTSYPQQVNGSFSTSDEVIQKALEASPAYNVNFYLFAKDGNKVESNTSPEVKKTTAPKQEVVEAVKETEEKAPERISVPGISNLQLAKNYLNKEHGIAINKMPNAVAVENRAKELGIYFPDMQN